MMALRKENIASFVKKAREQLDELWEALYVEPEERPLLLPAFASGTDEAIRQQIVSLEAQIILMKKH